MSRYLNFSTQVVNFPPGQVQTLNAVWIVHPGKKGQLYRTIIKVKGLRLNDEIKRLNDNNVKVNSRQVGECFYDFMSPHQRNGRQCEWASGKFHPCRLWSGVCRLNQQLNIFKIDILNESGFHWSPTALNVLKTHQNSYHGIFFDNNQHWFNLKYRVPFKWQSHIQVYIM